MINIYKTGSDAYILEIEQVKLPETNLKETAKAMYKLGVTFEEIEVGFEELIKNDHNYAAYGVNRMFIFSDRK